MAISIESEREWKSLCDLLAAFDLKDDPDLSDIKTRRLNYQKIESKITEWTKKRTNQQAMNQMQSKGIRAGIVAKASDILSDKHFSERG